MGSHLIMAFSFPHSLRSSFVRPSFVLRSSFVRPPVRPSFVLRSSARSLVFRFVRCLRLVGRLVGSVSSLRLVRPSRSGCCVFASCHVVMSSCLSSRPCVSWCSFRGGGAAVVRSCRLVGMSCSLSSVLSVSSCYHHHRAGRCVISAVTG